MLYGSGVLLGIKGFQAFPISDKAPVPGFKHHALGIVGQEGKLKAKAVGIVFQPLEGLSFAEFLIEVGAGLGDIADVDGVAGVVFAVAGGGH